MVKGRRHYIPVGWKTKYDVERSGKLYSGDGGYRQAVEEGRRFLSKTRCAELGVPVRKDEEPAAYVFNDDNDKEYCYMPMYERTDFFTTYSVLDKGYILNIDRIHLVPRSKMKRWGFRRFNDIPIVGYIEDYYKTECVYDISGTDKFLKGRLKALLDLDRDIEVYEREQEWLRRNEEENRVREERIKEIEEKKKKEEQGVS